MVDKLLDYIEQGINNKSEYFEFSVDLESYIVDEYDAIYDENPAIAEFAADEIPEITEPMEPGMDPTDFYNKLEILKEQIISMK